MRQRFPLSEHDELMAEIRKLREGQRYLAETLLIALAEHAATAEQLCELRCDVAGTTRETARNERNELRARILGPFNERLAPVLDSVFPPLPPHLHVTQTGVGDPES